MDACTAYQEHHIAVVREDGRPVATGTADVTVCCPDFIGDASSRQITHVTLLEVILPVDHPRFRHWNSRIGRQISTAEVERWV